MRLDGIPFEMVNGPRRQVTFGDSECLFHMPEAMVLSDNSVVIVPAKQISHL
jgi:hypothetical protein